MRRPTMDTCFICVFLLKLIIVGRRIFNWYGAAPGCIKIILGLGKRDHNAKLPAFRSIPEVVAQPHAVGLRFTLGRFLDVLYCRCKIRTEDVSGVGGQCLFSREDVKAPTRQFCRASYSSLKLRCITSLTSPFEERG